MGRRSFRDFTSYLVVPGSPLSMQIDISSSWRSEILLSDASTSDVSSIQSSSEVAAPESESY